MSPSVEPDPSGREERTAAPDALRSDGWLPALDGLRAVAVTAVLVHHVAYLSGLTNSVAYAGALLARLDVGVALFFALSGFLLYRPFALAAIRARPDPSVRRYLRRRALRILPAYWAMAVVALVWLNIDYLRSLWDWTIPLFLAQIYQPLRLPVGMEQTWSLATEVAFYLALPAVALLGRRLGGHTPQARAGRQLALGGGLVLAGLVWNAYAHGADSPLPQLSVLWLPAYLDWFGAGIMLSVLACWPTGTAPAVVGGPPVPSPGGTPPTDDHLWNATPRGLRTVTAAPGTSWLIAAALLWIASTPIAGPRSVEPATSAESLTEHLIFLAVAWYVIAPLVGPGSGGLPRRLLGHPLLRFLGRISYGIFLWHLLALEACFRLLGFTRFDSSFGVLLVLTVALTLPVAVASHRLIERPAQRLGRLLDRRSPRPGRPRGIDAGAGDRARVPVLHGAVPGQAEQPTGSPHPVPVVAPAETQQQGGDGDKQQAGREHTE
ncbi:acyltransferase family protein [Micromonospora sp. NPDC048868]|uniref:acyltransferase family protein n=1 Tax=Micromonospora sp. NPDC048868 TaxID=3364258 RepID=UPI0037119FFD